MENMPVELVWEIHIYALNASLATVSKWFRAVLLHAPSSVCAQWLIHYHTQVTQPRKDYNCVNLSTTLAPSLQFQELPLVLSGSLRHRICNPSTIRSISRLYKTKIPSHLLNKTTHSGLFPDIELPYWLFKQVCTCASPRDTGVEPSQKNTPIKLRLPLQTVMTHDCEVYPLRSVCCNGSIAEEQVLEILDTLESCFVTGSSGSLILKMDANSHRGAPLTNATLRGAKHLMSWLLAHGADPALKNAQSVRAAVYRGDVELVRLLVEHRDEGQFGESTFLPSKSITTLGKRRRLCDRVEITPSLVSEAMRRGARPIVDYFVLEKGCPADIRLLKPFLLGTG